MSPYLKSFGSLQVACWISDLVSYLCIDSLFILATFLRKDRDKDKNLFIGPQGFVVGYSKAPEQPQSSARPICHSHTMTSTGREPATIRIAAYRSSPHYTLRNFMSTLLSFGRCDKKWDPCFM